MKYSFFFRSLLTILILAFPLFISAQNGVSTDNRNAGFDVQHYRISVSFDADKKRVFAETVVEIKPTVDNLTSFTLDAVDLFFDSVQLESDHQNLKFSANNGKILIGLDKAYSPAETFAVRFKYSTSPAKGVYFVDAGTGGGKEIHSAQIWSQGEAEEARYWIPSNDFPDDKATSEEYITVPQDQTAIGNGDLIEKIDNPNSTVTYHYKMNVPHSTYLISFVVGKFLKVSDSYKNIPLGYYVYPNQEDFARLAFGKTPLMMKTFEELTGVDFPYNKYDQVTVAYFKFGGMENITATTIADTDISLANIKSRRDVAEDLVSHELSHSWFGDLVTTKDWANLWLNEGFATFMEAAYREKVYGRQNYLNKIREDYLEFLADESTNKNRHGLYNKLADPNSDNLFDVTTYQKGGLVVHTLRETVGDAAFWKGINIYLNRFKFKNVEYADLQKVMEETSGQKLDWFFKQWVVGAGMPDLVIKQNYQPARQSIQLTVSQIQGADKITPEVFTLPLEVEIKTSKGLQNEKISITKRVETFTIKTGEKPTGIFFDKNIKIPLKKVKVEPLTVDNKFKTV